MITRRGKSRVILVGWSISCLERFVPGAFRALIAGAFGELSIYQLVQHIFELGGFSILRLER